jgi:hypothetical protein
MSNFMFLREGTKHCVRFVPHKTCIHPWLWGCINFLIIWLYTPLYVHIFSLSYTHVCMHAACCVCVCVYVCVFVCVCGSFEFSGIETGNENVDNFRVTLEYTLSTDPVQYNSSILCSKLCQQILCSTLCQQTLCSTLCQQILCSTLCQLILCSTLCQLILCSTLCQQIPCSTLCQQIFCSTLCQQILSSTLCQQIPSFGTHERHRVTDSWWHLMWVSHN